MLFNNSHPLVVVYAIFWAVYRNKTFFSDSIDLWNKTSVSGIENRVLVIFNARITYVSRTFSKILSLTSIFQHYFCILFIIQNNYRTVCIETENGRMNGMAIFTGACL